MPENDTKRPPEIFGGDLVIAVEILVTLADYNAKQGNVSAEEDTGNFAQVASSLLETTNRITWQELERVSISLVSFVEYTPVLTVSTYQSLSEQGSMAIKLGTRENKVENTRTKAVFLIF